MTTRSEKQKEQGRKWYLANRDKVKEKARLWGKANPEKQAAAIRKWGVANPERQKETKRKWYLANPVKMREYNGKRYAADPEKWREYYRLLNLRKFGLTPTDYDAMMTAQGGGCAICKRKPGKYRLCVDHCHATGAVRGLLCVACNTTIGKHFDSPERLEALLKYVRKHSQLRLVVNHL